MKKVVYILGELDDDDADWLVEVGRRRDVPDGTAIVRQGEPIDSVFFVTRGVLRVTTGPSGIEVARLGTGEVVGEVSYVDHRPPTATVTAVEDARVLEIPRAALTEKLESDAAFASRFYKAIATFLADRLRQTLLQVEGGAPDASDDELDLDRLHSLSQAGVRFEGILRKLQEV